MALRVKLAVVAGRVMLRPLYTQVLEPPEHAVRVGFARLMAFTVLAPEEETPPTTLMVELMFRPVVVVAAAASKVVASVKVMLAVFPVSAAVWAYVAPPKAKMLPVVMAIPPPKVMPVWVVSVPQFQVWAKLTFAMVLTAVAATILLRALLRVVHERFPEPSFWRTWTPDAWAEGQVTV
jgi:hypothetical protein